jgi:DNA repair protein RadC
MTGFRTLLCGSTLLVLLAGCGPMQTPLPPRPSDEDQRSINQAWESVLAPMDRYGNQAWLDILMVTQAYQAGVDKLEFRSEKTFSGGSVVMEAHYDRLAAERDRFAVTVLDPQGKVLRQETYGREQVDRTYRELFKEYEELRRKQAAGEASAAELSRLEELEARHSVVQRAFPGSAADEADQDR